MAVFSRSVLITELLDRTELIKASSQTFLRLSDEQLHYRSAPDKWSITEIFGHLNIYQDQYIRTMLSHITLAPDLPSDRYNSSWVGDWIYEKVMPRADGTIFKLKTTKAWNVSGRSLDARDALGSFQRKCDALDDILRHAATKNLQRIKIPFNSSSLFRLRLGDTLRMLVAHNERHLLQAQRVMKELT